MEINFMSEPSLASTAPAPEKDKFSGKILLNFVNYFCTSRKLRRTHYRNTIEDCDYSLSLSATFLCHSASFCDFSLTFCLFLLHYCFSICFIKKWFNNNKYMIYFCKNYYWQIRAHNIKKSVRFKKKTIIRLQSFPFWYF